MQAFKNLPETLDEVDARLNEERARSECFSGLSENVSALLILSHYRDILGFTYICMLTFNKYSDT